MHSYTLSPQNDKSEGAESKKNCQPSIYMAERMKFHVTFMPRIRQICQNRNKLASLKKAFQYAISQVL